MAPHISFCASHLPSLWSLKKVAEPFPVITEKSRFLASATPRLYGLGDLFYFLGGSAFLMFSEYKCGKKGKKCNSVLEFFSAFE